MVETRLPKEIIFLALYKSSFSLLQKGLYLMSKFKTTSVLKSSNPEIT